MSALTSTYDVPTVPWAEFVRAFNWRQGEHVSVIGRTGSGKSVLGNELVEFRDWTVAFGVKPVDETLDELISAHGFRRITAWPPKPKWQRVVLWPRIRTSEDIDDAGPTFHKALSSIFTSLGWTLYIDEVRYIADRLDLGKQLIDMWILGRAGRLSLLGCAQRPTWVPLEMLTQATHVFLFRTNGKDDLDRLRHLAGVDGDMVRRAVSVLPSHAFLYLNTVTGQLAISRVEKG